MPPNTAIPVQFCSDCYVALPPALISAVGRYFRDGAEAEATEIRRLASARGSPVEILTSDTLLVPEIFAYERAKYFREMSNQQLQRCRFIIYDLLPFTHPEYFLPHLPGVMSEYFHIMRRANYCGFISEYTRDAFYGRLMRTATRGGVVLPLGSDSLGPRNSRPTANRSLAFTVLGTIEPRKNHALILEAFEPLLGKIQGLTLSFVGRMGWVDSDFARRVHALASDNRSGFQFHDAPTDSAIRIQIEQSRATIYASDAEGYGLPPVESLWLGTPVIASKTIPSLQALPGAGIHYVEPLDVERLRQAVLAFLDDGYANQKVEEALHLELPTWRSFTQEVLRWCNQDCP
ncbi:MAG TPA: glycosyltransferase [Bryobacteraceae bacterium]